MITEKSLSLPDFANDEERLVGRVASILNAKELVINIGASKGVISGMRFAVMAEAPMSVIDPETGEILDMIDREKVRVEAIEVREKISICRTFRKREIPAGPLYTTSLLPNGLANLSAPPKTIEEDLKVQNDSLPPPLSPEDSYVKVNDRVIYVS